MVPCGFQRIPESHSRCFTNALQATPVTLEPIGSLSLKGLRVIHHLPVIFKVRLRRRQIFTDSACGFFLSGERLHFLYEDTSIARFMLELMATFAQSFFPEPKDHKIYPIS